MLVLCCPQNGRSSPAPGASVLNLPCPRGLMAPTASAPPLLSPDGVPVRWLLMDGYVYDIRDDQDHPPSRKFLSGLVDVEADDRPTGQHHGFKACWLR